MGRIIQASCECGYESEHLFIGSGFLDMNHDRYLAPAVCFNCHKISEKNYLAKYPRCPSCRKKIIFYNDPILGADSNDSSEYDEKNEGEFTLPDNSYLCPKCGQMKMRFFNAGNWD